MKYLLILRHAKSSWKQPFSTDHDRPLNKRGKHDAPRMGDLLSREDLIPDLIITSSAVRAVMTAEAAAQSSGFTGDLIMSRSLYHAGTMGFIDALNGVGDEFDRVMVVGHNPGIEELLVDLAGSYERMVTAALAHIALPVESWGRLDESVQGSLLNFWRPKDLSVS
jgi:phosphohistidine phosphatase